MRKLIPTLLSGAALTLLTLGSAGAATLQIVGGTPFTLNANFDPGGWGNPDGIGQGTGIKTFNSLTASTGGLQINPSIAGPAAVTMVFTFMGFEASYTNVFEASFSYNPATPMFTNQTTGLGASSGPVTVNLTSPGYIPLLFASNGYNPAAVATNNGPVNSNVELGLIIDPKNSNIAYAFFEDIGPNCPGDHCGGDQDFDDMVVKIELRSSTELTNTPLPAALPMFIGGAGLIGLLARRRKQKRAA